jgi:hypothetical protein
MDPEPEAEQEVEPFSGNAFTSGNTVRNPGSRVLHLFMIPPLLLVLALSVTSLSYFAVIDDKVGAGDKDYICSGKCILFAKWNGDSLCIDLSSGHACVFSIFGEVAVAVLSALLVVWMIVKASAGFYITTWVLVCEVPLLTLHMVFAFCVSITISIGLAFTCDAYDHFEGATGGCGNYSLPDPTTTDLHFYDHLKKSMVTSWLAVVVLFLLLCVHVFLIIFFCVKRVRKSTHELLPVSDGESSSDGDSTDEAMVPIAELERR